MTTPISALNPATTGSNIPAAHINNLTQDVYELYDAVEAIADGLDEYIDEQAARGNCYVEAHRATSNQSLTSATWNVVQFNTEDVDVGGHFNPGTYRFTADADGIYLFSISIQINRGIAAAGSTTVLGVGVNGASPTKPLDINVFQAASGEDYQLNGSSPVRLSAGDYAQAFVRPPGASHEVFLGQDNGAWVSSMTVCRIA